MSIFSPEEVAEVASSDVLKDIETRVKLDPAEAFKPEVLQALAALDQVSYQRIFSKIKEPLAGRMREYKKEIGDARTRRPRQEPPTPANMMERGDQAEIADRFLVEIAPDPENIVHDEGHLWVFRNGTWEDLSKPYYMTCIKKMAGAPTSEGPLRMSYSTAKGAFEFACDVVHQENFFGQARHGITFRNGFVSISKEGIAELTPLGADNRARHRYEFDYQSDAPCPMWIDALEVWFKGDDDKDDKIRCLQEMAGAALLGIGPKYEKFHILMGSGEEGKSTFLKILKGAMAPGMTCAVPPQDWNNEYRLAMLANRRLNVVSELPQESILCSELFKGIITGDPVTGREIREAPFTFEPIATHIFAGNLLPEVKDLSHGFWRRPNIIKYNRTLLEEEKNKNIVSDVLGKEMAGLVTWMIQGAARLVAQKTYTIPESSTSEVRAWRLQTDQVLAFLTECTTPCPHEAGNTASEIYNSYRQWQMLEHSDFPVLSQTMFGRRMTNHKKSSSKCGDHMRYPALLRNVSGTFKTNVPTS